MDNPNPKKPTSSNLLERISTAISLGLESIFYRWGFLIASHPWKIILGCLLLAIFCSSGLYGFTRENRPIHLWIPWDSDFIKDTEWMKEHFPHPIRHHYAIITADNILDPKIIQLIQDIHVQVNAIKVNNKTWEDLCFKLPVSPTEQSGRRRRDIVQVQSANEISYTSSDGGYLDFDDFLSEPFFQDDYKRQESESDPSIYLPSDIYCEKVNSLKRACWEINILELWNYSSSVINNLTEDDVIRTINSHKISPVFGREVNYTKELSGVRRNERGQIVSANAVLIRWFSRINHTAIQNGHKEMDKGTGETVDTDNFNWETELKNVLLNYSLPEGVNLYLKVARSFGDISDSTIWGDAYKLAFGFSLVFIYVFFMLGQWNFIYQRPILSLAGLSCIGLAIPVSYGICSSFKLIFGPVHHILPFLLLGIGIDDMFVIMQCWNNLSPSLAKLSLPERVGLALKHAGVSITVTSITDIAAFAVGGTTVLPALQSFCIYAALGVLATYFFQATFFTAWLCLDMRRVEDNRNAYIICYKHRNYVPTSCSQQNFSQRFFGGVYSNLLLTRIGKSIVLALTIVLCGLNLWGNTHLRQEFDPAWFLPRDSYLAKYAKARNEYFPGMGHEAVIVINNVSLNSNLRQFDELVNKLNASKFVHEVEAWYPGFKRYVNMHFGAGIPNTEMNEKKFNQYISKFLYSPSGAKFRERFKFDGNISCGVSAPPVETHVISFKFRSFSGPEEHLPAMRELKGIVKTANLNFTSDRLNNSFLWSFAFAAWETDEIITVELYRNMGLALLCVLITTLLLIANVKTCLMVLLCVILTIVDVLGGMYFWGLTIDTVSCIDLVLAVGLCVDYAAHIGHAFMINTGSRDKRAKQALRDIGPAVLNGGFSTFLALLLVSNAKSHVFDSFFKIFTMVVIFGLYHGLVFLPVLLSLFGSQHYARTEQMFHGHLLDMENQSVALVIKGKENGLYPNGNGSVHSVHTNGNGNVHQNGNIHLNGNGNVHQNGNSCEHHIGNGNVHQNDNRSTHVYHPVENDEKREIGINNT